MSLSDSELLARLTGAIMERIPASYGTDAQLETTPPIELHRRYSFMFRYHIRLPNGMRQTILVKIPHDYWMKTLHEAVESEHIRGVITSEFETMTVIANAIEEANEPKLAAIRPRALLLPYKALLMDEIPIKMLKTILSKIPIILGMKKDWDELENYLHLSGKWLRVIHRKYAHEQMSLPALAVMERVEKSLAAINPAHGRSLDALHNLFRKLYDSIKTVQVSSASLHNDYHPGNVFLTDDGRIGALDPNWMEKGSIYTDLASMLVYPVTGKMAVLTQGILFRKSLRKRYEKAVLRGYFDRGESADPILLFYCASAILEKWQDNIARLRSEKSLWYRAASKLLILWNGFYFRRLVNDYLLRGLLGK